MTADELRDAMPVVRVSWHDSMSTTGWRTVAEATAELHQADFLECQSVGFLVGETPDRIMLALSRQNVAGGEPMVGETVVIPKAAITAMAHPTEEPSRQRRRTSSWRAAWLDLSNPAEKGAEE